MLFTQQAGWLRVKGKLPPAGAFNIGDSDKWQSLTTTTYLRVTRTGY